MQMKNLMLALCTVACLPWAQAQTVVSTQDAGLGLKASLPAPDEIRLWSRLFPTDSSAPKLSDKSDDFGVGGDCGRATRMELSGYQNWRRNSSASVALVVPLARKSLCRSDLEPIEVRAAFVVNKRVERFSKDRLFTMASVERLFRVQDSGSSFQIKETAIEDVLSKKSTKPVLPSSRDYESILTAFKDNQNKSGSLMVSTKVEFPSYIQSAISNLSSGKYEPFLSLHSRLYFLEQAEWAGDEALQRTEIAPLNLYSKDPAAVFFQDIYLANQWIGFGSQRVVFYEVDEDRTLVVLLATIAPIRSIMEKKRGVMGYRVSGREVMLGTAFPGMESYLGVLLSGIPNFFGAVTKNLHQALSEF
jgi:hypothetical protein